MRRGRLDVNFNPERDGEIVFEVDETGGTLNVSDNGAGMSRDTILDVFRYYGRTDKTANDEVGNFGVGAKSIFASADAFTIHTQSLDTNETTQVYGTLEGISFQPSPPLRRGYGTTITIPLHTDKMEQQQRVHVEQVEHFCKCVKVPVYLARGTERRLVSRGLPWTDGDTYAITCDDFELFLNSSETGTGSYCRFYMEGFFVKESIESGFLNGVAVNLARRDVANLTMSRDDLIRDEKYEELLREVVEAILDHAESFQFDSRTLVDQDGWRFIQWLEKNRHVQELWTKLSGKAQEAITTLTRDVRVCPSIRSWWCRERDKYKANLVELLRRPEPKYFAFHGQRDFLERIAEEKKALIIYHHGDAHKNVLMDWLKRLGIPPLSLNGDKPGRYALCTPTGIFHCDTIEQLEHSKPKQEPVYAFPSRRIQLRILEQLARRLNAYALKLSDGEALPRNAVDLTKNTDDSTVIFRGKEATASCINVSEVTVAPPEFYGLAHSPTATRTTMAFPQNLTGACLLIARGAKLANFQAQFELLEASVPEEVRDTLRHIRELAYCRTLAKLASIIQWNHPYAPWLFEYAAKNPWLANDIVEDVQTSLQAPTLEGTEVSHHT
jgi:hypothetical protein